MSETTLTAQNITGLLLERYSNKPLEWATFTELRSGVGFGRGSDPIRSIDFYAVRIWGKVHERIAHEIKVSRADWLREIDNMDKSRPFADDSHEFFVVAPDGIVKERELPEAWGLMVATPDGIRVKVRAKRREAPALSEQLMLSLLRAGSFQPRAPQLYKYGGEELSEAALLEVAARQLNSSLKELVEKGVERRRADIQDKSTNADLGRWVTSNLGIYDTFSADNKLRRVRELAAIGERVREVGRLAVELRAAADALDRLAESPAGSGGAASGGLSDRKGAVEA